MIDLSFPKRGRRGGLSHPVGRQDTEPPPVFPCQSQNRPLIVIHLLSTQKNRPLVFSNRSLSLMSFFA